MNMFLPMISNPNILYLAYVNTHINVTNDVSIQWKWYHISAGASGKEIELKINRPYNKLILK